MGNIASSSNIINSNDEMNLNDCITKLHNLVTEKFMLDPNKYNDPIKRKDIEIIRSNTEFSNLKKYYDRLNSLRKVLEEFQKNPAENSQNQEVRKLFNIFKNKQQDMSDETKIALDKYNLLIRLIMKKRLIYRYSILYLTIKILSLNNVLRYHLQMLDSTIGGVMQTYSMKENHKEIYEKIMNIITTLDKNKFSNTSEDLKKKEAEIEKIRNQYNENFNKIKEMSVKILSSTTAKPIEMIGGGDTSSIDKIQNNTINNFMEGYKTDYETYKQYDRRAKFYIKNVTIIIQAYSDIYKTLLQQKKKENDGIDMDELTKKFNDSTIFLETYIPRSTVNPISAEKISFKNLLLRTIEIINRNNQEFKKEFDPIIEQLQKSNEDNEDN